MKCETPFATFVHMNANNTESVKLKTEVVQLARDHKDKTGLPVKQFIERAVIEKSKRIKSKKKL